MMFDEEGQAVTVEHKLRIARRAYHLLTEKVGMPAHDVIFDPNILTVGTGIDEHRRYAANFVEASDFLVFDVQPCEGIPVAIPRTLQPSNFLPIPMAVITK